MISRGNGPSHQVPYPVSLPRVDDIFFHLALFASQEELKGAVWEDLELKRSPWAIPLELDSAAAHRKNARNRWPERL